MTHRFPLNHIALELMRPALLVTLVAAGCSCSSDEEPFVEVPIPPDQVRPSPDSTDESPSVNYFPLRAPRRLLYSIKYKAPLYGEGRGKAVTNTLFVKVNDQQYCKHTTEVTGTPLDRVYHAFYRETDQGIRRKYRSQTWETLFLAKPYNVGLTWADECQKDPDDLTIVGMEDVVTKATTYSDCLKVSTDGENLWFAPDIGLVQFQIQSSLFDSMMTLVSVE